MKKMLLLLRDIMEIYVPTISFIIMFSTFVLQVFCRYILNYPLTWAQEVTVIGFVWVVIFGACYTMRYRQHVKFTMLYDALKPKAAAITRLLGNIIIMVTFCLLIVPGLKFAQFMSFQSTAVFKINLFWVFIPFVYFLCAIVGYTLSEIVVDIRKITGIELEKTKEGVEL